MAMSVNRSPTAMLATHAIFLIKSEMFPYSEPISSDDHHKPYDIYQVFDNYSI